MEQSRRRRKKNVYVEYDYEEAYQKQIENLEEDIIKRMMDGKKIKYVYATKEIKAGEQLEVEIYPEFTRKRVEEIPEEGRRKKDRQAQRNLNEKNSRKQCERVINENFGDRDIWATFTYSAEYTCKYESGEEPYAELHPPPELPEKEERSSECSVCVCYGERRKRQMASSHRTRRRHGHGHSGKPLDIRKEESGSPPSERRKRPRGDGEICVKAEGLRRRKVSKNLDSIEEPEETG